jgi:TolB-like protein/tetratricopeptide (TPR) repeat protein
MAQRRLAAILFSDIVGYTSLLKEEEKKAFDQLKKNRRIHKRLIKKFNGRWLKDIESGVLVSFSSIIDAVMCAISIQKATQEIEIPVRVGIHQGEVIFEKKDVLGDGVNIASRIQGLAKSNEIVVTERVYDDIKNKEGLETKFHGEQTLKGVAKPIGTYKLSCSDDSLLDFTIDTGELVRPLSFGRTTIVVGIMIIALIAYALYYFIPKFTQSSSKLGTSVLILPFNNYLGTDTLDYFVAGMHDALISDIGQVSALNVKSKTTANSIKNTNKSIPEIADDLGVNTFVEGAVLCLGDSVCFQAKLFDQEEKVLWIRDYKVEKSQILNLYNMVTKDITDRINVTLTPLEEKLLTETRSVDNEAYDAYIKGKPYLDRISPESLPIAAEYFKRAIEIDPDWAPPYAGLAEVGAYEKQMGFVSPSQSTQMIYKNLNKAFELDPNSANSHYTKAVIAVWTEWDWDTGEKEFKKALELNPNDALCRMFYAHLLGILQRPDEALYQANLAVELDPMRPFILALNVSVLAEIGDSQSAIKHCKKALSIDPENYFAIYALESMYYWNGDLYKSIEMLTQYPFIEENIRFTMKHAYEEHGYAAAIEVLLTAREEIAKEKFVNPWDMASDYARVKKYDKIVDWLEKGYEIHSPMMPYIGSTEIRSDELENNPRYIELLKKMNLPLP